jgi:hypothetical protein
VEESEEGEGGEEDRIYRCLMVEREDECRNYALVWYFFDCTLSRDIDDGHGHVQGCFKANVQCNAK